MGDDFSFGPYEADSLHSPSRSLARRYFFDEIERHRPQVAEDLYNSSFKLFVHLIRPRCKELEPQVSAQPSTLDAFLRSVEIQSVQTEVPILAADWKALQKIDEASVLRQSLSLWHVRWNLTDEWCLDYALKVLHVWLRNGAERRNHWWGKAGLEIIMDESIWAGERDALRCRFFQSFGTDGNLPPFRVKYDDFVFERDGWNLFEEDGGEWEQRTTKAFNKNLERHRRKGTAPKTVKGDFEKRIKDHINNLKMHAEKVGLKRTARKLAHRHFEWLVLFQIPPRMLKGEIARRAAADVKTISEGIENTASLIGLTLQPSASAGRPPKKLSGKE